VCSRAVDLTARAIRPASRGLPLHIVRWNSVSQRPGSDQYVCPIEDQSKTYVDETSVNFPGAVNAKFTTLLKFSNPAEETAMPVYRVMDADGKIVDKNRAPPDIFGEELVKLYKDMLISSFWHFMVYYNY